jgi:SAM-dependent methyltransferase
VNGVQEVSAMGATYDSIGINYAELRRPDRRIARIIERALGSAHSVLNVGAGTGSYEPTDRSLTAVEPSAEMIRGRSPTAAKAVQASADDLPFDDKSFDASMAILTVHHWPDKEAGLREMRRATRGRIVLLTFDPSQRPWLTDYLPELAALDETHMPRMSDYERWLGPVEISPVSVPRWLPVRLLATARGLSRSVRSIRKFVLLEHRPRRSRIAEVEAGYRIRRVAAPLCRFAEPRRIRRGIPARGGRWIRTRRQR